MYFKYINLVYIPIWFFNIFSAIIAMRIDEVLISFDSYSNKFKKWICQNQSLLSFLLKTKSILFIPLSLILSVISCFVDIQLTRIIIGIYFIMTFIDLCINALFYSIFRRI